MVPQPQEELQKRPLPLWVRWSIVLLVLVVIVAGTILWIIQGTQAIIPIAVFTALGILLAFFQVLHLLFPSIRNEHSTNPPSQQTFAGQHHLPSTVSTQPPPLQTQGYSHENDEITPTPFTPMVSQHEQNACNRSTGETKIYWGESPHTEQFYGRGKELTELRQWLINGHCRMIGIFGIGGIGKTSLAVTLTKQVQDEFDYVFWHSLQNASPLDDYLKQCILFLSDQQQFDLPKDADHQIPLLIDSLKKRRCLLVLDNVETILQSGHHVGQYQEGYEGYGLLFQRVGEAHHQSCLLLTSREKPKEVALLDGAISPVRSLQLSGLGQLDGKEILRDKGLFGSDDAYTSLIQLYGGNPLALKLVSESVRELFDGDVSEFLKNREMGVDLQDLLDQQFKRLSALEQEIMYWLAIEREVVSSDDLRDVIVPSRLKRDLLEALASLRRRSMIDISGAARFILQPVIREYMTSMLVERTCQEIDAEAITLLGSHALIKAQAKDYVRESQTRLILKSIIDRLLTTLRKEEIEEKLRSMLALLHEKEPYIPNYAGGNILNLLIQLKTDLRGYDFSHLTIRQAYLQSKALPDVNFAYSNLEKSVFTEIFDDVLSVTFSPNGELLAMGTARGEVGIWHVSGSSPLQVCRGHTGWVRSVAFSPDGKTLASGSHDQTIRLWEVDSGHCFHILQGHTDQVRSVTFSPDGKTLASGSHDQTIRLWEVDSGRSLHIFQGNTNQIRSVAFSPDGDVLASGGDDQTIRLWEVKTGCCLNILQGHTKRVRSIAFSLNGNVLASGSEDQTIRLWKVSTGECFKTLQGHTNQVRSVAFSPNGKILASGGDDQVVRLWEISSANCLHALQGHTNRVWSVAFNPSGDVLATGGDDQVVRLWEVDTGYCLRVLQGYTNQAKRIVFSPDGSLVANGDNQTVRLWQVSNGRCLHTLQGHTNQVLTVAFSPSGNLLASSGEDQTVRLWQVSNGRCLHTLQGHTNQVGSVTFNPDNPILASSSEDQTVRLWDVSSGRCLHELQGHTNIDLSLSVQIRKFWPVAVKTKLFDCGRSILGIACISCKAIQIGSGRLPSVLMEICLQVVATIGQFGYGMLAVSIAFISCKAIQIGSGRWLLAPTGNS